MLLWYYKERRKGAFGGGEGINTDTNIPQGVFSSVPPWGREIPSRNAFFKKKEISKDFEGIFKSLIIRDEMIFPGFDRGSKNKISWCFFQGYFEKEGSSDRHHFMTCFFQVASQEKDIPPGHYLISSITGDGLSHNHSYSSMVDSQAIDILLENPNSHKANISEHLKRSYLEEVQEYGPPEPIRLSGELPHFSEDNLSVRWENFSLKQEHNLISLQFDTGVLGILQATLEVTRPLFSYNESFPDGSGYSDVVSYTQMKLQGSVNNEQVSGAAWFDFQHSDYGMFQSEKHGEKVLGWDWWGITLTDGPDLILYIYRDVESGKVVSQKGYILGERPSSIESFEVEVQSTWQSPSSGITYPQTVEVTIAELDIQLVMEPLCANQEIPVLGTYRSIWEGVGNVSGYREGHSVTGTARMEYFGYGYIFDIQRYLRSFTDKIDRHIEDFLPRRIDESWMNDRIGHPEWLHDIHGCTQAIAVPVWDLLDRKGKHWRPVCGHLFLCSLEVDPQPYEQIMAVVAELNHTGSLIIDDIEDDSLIRRGRECIHLIYGIDTAINAGNILYFLPYLLLRDHPAIDDGQRLASYELMVSMLTKCHIGQGLDIHWSKCFTEETLLQSIDEGLKEKILQMYSYKTGAQIEGTAQMACIIAKANKQKTSAYCSLGRAFGVAFQIIDDVHNFNDSKGWTKKRGEDIASGTPSYAIMQALEMLKPAQRKRLLSIFCSKEKRQSPENIEEAVDLIIASKALEKCKSKAHALMEQSWENFARYARHNDGKILLKMFMNSILNYSYDV